MRRDGGAPGAAPGTFDTERVRQTQHPHVGITDLALVLVPECGRSGAQVRHTRLCGGGLGQRDEVAALEIEHGLLRNVARRTIAAQHACDIGVDAPLMRREVLIGGQMSAP